jgi:hypothetical protein
MKLKDNLIIGIKISLVVEKDNGNVIEWLLRVMFRSAGSNVDEERRRKNEGTRHMIL